MVKEEEEEEEEEEGEGEQRIRQGSPCNHGIVPFSTPGPVGGVPSVSSHCLPCLRTVHRGNKKKLTC